jgi:hypothetical protein
VQRADDSDAGTARRAPTRRIARSSQHAEFLDWISASPGTPSGVQRDPRSVIASPLPGVPFPPWRL